MVNQFKSVLLIVDVQNDFCPGGALAVPNGNKVIEPLNNMLAYIRNVDRWSSTLKWVKFASRDWHPRQTKHFAEFGGQWPIHCVQNTPGAEFHSQLSIGIDIFIISKGTKPDEDGYSPFQGTVREVSFEQFLDLFNVRGVYIGGLATDYCVKAAAMDAVKKGFKTYLLTDACRAVNIKLGDEALALNEMANAGVEFITTEDVIYG